MSCIAMAATSPYCSCIITVISAPVYLSSVCSGQHAAQHHKVGAAYAPHFHLDQLVFTYDVSAQREDARQQELSPCLYVFWSPTNFTLQLLTHIYIFNHSNTRTVSDLQYIEHLHATTMSDELYLEPNLFSSPQSSFTRTKSSSKPNDDFSTRPLGPNTIFYLAIIAPHTDTYQVLGPVTTFSHLLPKIEDIVSNSPKAIDKLAAIRSIEDVWGDSEPNLEFAERGFSTFVVDGQRGVYTVLKILREENEAVKEELPSPVYTITTHGPLSHKGEGYVATTKLVGSYVERAEAKGAAEKAMRDLVKGEKGLKESEDWGRESKGGGMLIAMNSETRWEVRIGYEDEVHKRAKEELERDGEKVGWRF